MKPRKLVYAMLLLLLGAGYFSTFSNLDMHPLLSFQLFLLPIQLSLAVYFVAVKRAPETPDRQGEL